MHLKWAADMNNVGLLNDPPKDAHLAEFYYLLVS